MTHPVGKEGQLKQRMNIAGVTGGWCDEVAAINTLIDDLVWPTARSHAHGDRRGGEGRSRAIDGARSRRPAARAEFLRSARLVNNMIDQLSVSTSVTRVAREVGTEGKLGGQAQVKASRVSGKNSPSRSIKMAGNLTAQVRNIADVTIAVANGDLSKKITVDVRGEILQLKEAIDTMVDRLRGFAAEVTRVAREVGTDGKLGGQAVVPDVAQHLGEISPTRSTPWRRTSRRRSAASPASRRRLRRGDLSRKITVDVKGEFSSSRHRQHDGRSVERVLRRKSAASPAGRHGGKARRPGRSA